MIGHSLALTNNTNYVLKVLLVLKKRGKNADSSLTSSSGSKFYGQREWRIL